MLREQCASVARTETLDAALQMDLSSMLTKTRKGASTKKKEEKVVEKKFDVRICLLAVYACLNFMTTHAQTLFSAR